jgi:cytochrome c biogenesis protein CcmG, thiol:disulfide interchange protein DsbE
MGVCQGMSPMRTRALVLAVAALLAVIGIVLLTSDSSDSGDDATTDPAAERAYADAPPPLRGLYDQRNQLLDGGPDAFRERVAGLRGYPIVVNKWASWCGPCRAEFPVFQKAAIQEARRIAFLGVDSTDNDGDAREFLSEFPLTYPSYKDPDLKVAAVFNGVGAFPTTAFYDERGKVAYVHQGPYHSVDELLADVRKYTG